MPLVNIAQIFNRSGLMLTCKKASGVTEPEGLQGQDARRLVRRQRVSVPELDGQARPEARRTDVKVLKQGFNVDPLLQNQAACISTMIYNEYWQVVDAGVKEADLVTFFYEDQGVASLEDGLYVARAQAEGPGLRRPHGQVPEATLQGLERRA